MNTKGVDFFENGLCYHCHLVKNELAVFRDYHCATEALWQRADKELQAQIDEILARHPESDHDDLIESHGWELHLNQSRYPDLHRDALVVSICAYIEDQLNGLCRILEESLKSKIGIRDLEGKGVSRALTFLSKVALFDLEKSKTRAFVVNTYNLRNVLVHRGGTLYELSSDNKGLSKFVSENDGLTGKPGQKVRIDSSFVQTLLGKLEHFFDEIDDQVKKFMKEFGKAK